MASGASSSESVWAMGLGVGRRNRSAMRMFAGELRDEGDEGSPAS